MSEVVSCIWKSSDDIYAWQGQGKISLCKHCQFW